MNKTLLVCLVLFMSLAASGQKSDKWQGYDRTFITIGNHTGYYVKPAKALPGNPWVWRASFPDYHPAVDTILLSRGFYVAYLSIDNQYGSPGAMQVWDKFYNYLTDTLHLATKVCLEDVSRGALYALAWAKRNPDKVSCIYSETPVYDFKSWPGGKGKGPGDTAAWRQLKEVYHFTEEQALAYKDNPVDNLEGLAAFKVPVLNVTGIHDQLAPFAENTSPFVERYTALGGPVAIYPVTEGPEELQGHHFPIKHAINYADFIYYNSYPVKKVLPYTNYIHVRKGTGNFYNAAAIGKKATVAFLGGSITDNPGWRQMVCAYLRERFPEIDFHFIAAGIPSLGSLPHAFRLQRDVLDSGKVDLMFVEAAVNDRTNGTDSLTQVKALEGIVRHALKSSPLMDIVMMEFADEDKFGDYRKGKTPIETFNHELVANHYGLPSIDLAKEAYDKIQNKELNWKDDFKDVHPAPYGQALYFETIKKLLEICLNGTAPVKNKPTLVRSSLNKTSFVNGSYYSIKNAKVDGNWTLDESWKPTDHLPTRKGFVNVPVLSSATPGATLRLQFKGSAIGIAVISGADAGMISWSVDGEPFKLIDLFTKWSNSLYIPWYILLKGDLHQGTHTLTIKISEQHNKASKGNNCHLVYFLKNG